MTEAQPTPESAATPDVAPAAGTIILRNTLYLSIAEALAMPLSILNNALLGRFLGPADFGNMYLGGTLSAFAFLAVEWGAQGSLPAEIARDRSQSGKFLGTALAWRISAAPFAFAIVALGCKLAGYDAQLQAAFALMFLGYTLSSLLNACQDAIRGLERTDIAALGRVGLPIVTLLVATPVLLLGGKLRLALLAHAAATSIVLIIVTRQLRPTGIGKLSFSLEALKRLFAGGKPFVLFSVAMVLQPQIDAAFLSKLAPPEVTGWYAGARKLVGALIFPANALVGSLYPTLCRLHITDQRAFMRTASGALRGVSLLAVPISLSCFCFPEIGIALLSSETFAPAADDLRVLAVLLFLTYFSMPLGVCLLAGGQQRMWGWVQAICVVVSLTLDPILVPWTQRNLNNGGLGVCAASVFSELIVVACGLGMMPREALDKAQARSLGLALLSGLVMLAVAQAGRSVTPVVVAPLALFAYGAAVWFSGALERELAMKSVAFLRQKLLRRRAA